MENIRRRTVLGDSVTRFPLTYPALADGGQSFVTSGSIRTEQDANYGKIPYGLNEYVCGTPYSGFTSEMGEEYGGKVIPYHELNEWLYEFRRYYGLIYSNGCSVPYSSATDYHDSVYGRFSGGRAAYEEMDAGFIRHGGRKFYMWIITNYFISLDLRNELYAALDEVVGFSMTMREWSSVLDYLGSDVMYYPDVVELYGRMRALYLKYGEDPDPSVQEDCCECLDYVRKGGYRTCVILQNWLSKATANIGTVNERVRHSLERYDELRAMTDRTEEQEREMEMMDLNPYLHVSIHLQRKFEDFGNFTSFCSEFIPGRVYSEGSICMYGGDCHIHNSSTSPGYKTDQYGNYVFDGDAWDDYTEVYMAAHPEEFGTQSPSYVLTGRTVSSLDMFIREEDTVDCAGNKMPGYYRAPAGYTLSQPEENEFLDIVYEIGKSVVREKVGPGKFYGDVLESAMLYLCDEQGEIITDTMVYVLEGDDLFSKIDDCVGRVPSGATTDNVLRVDFTYYKGCMFSYSGGRAVVDGWREGGVIYKYGVMCVDHCRLAEKSCQYELPYGESYAVRYYEVQKDVERRWSDEYGVEAEVAMCDFTLCPYTYGENDLVVTPSMRKEELLGFSLPESVENNIYVDRGYATAMDRHMKVCEASSVEDLAKYGNGSFNMINLEEESR